MATTKDWLRFFGAAGIPRAECARYAVTFLENRITMDMLADLNKEYLRDMGINILGDIIRILKQAKTVGGKMCEEKALTASGPATPIQSPPPVQQQPTTIPPAPSLPPVRASPQLQMHSNTTAKMRLGPPQEIQFADLKRKQQDNNTASVSGKGAGGNSNSSAAGDVFGRLEKRMSDSPTDNSKHDFQPRGTPSAPIGGEKRQVRNGTSPQKGPATKNSSKSSAFSRLGEQSSISPPSHTSQPQQKPPPSASPERKKSYILVRTLRDGTKTRERIEAGDPILDRVRISKPGEKYCPERHTRHLFNKQDSAPSRSRSRSPIMARNPSPPPPPPPRRSIPAPPPLRNNEQQQRRSLQAPPPQQRQQPQHTAVRMRSRIRSPPRFQKQHVASRSRSPPLRYQKQHVASRSRSRSPPRYQQSFHNRAARSPPRSSSTVHSRLGGNSSSGKFRGSPEGNVTREPVKKRQPIMPPRGDLRGRDDGGETKRLNKRDVPYQTAKPRYQVSPPGRRHDNGYKGAAPPKPYRGGVRDRLGSGSSSSRSDGPRKGGVFDRISYDGGR